MDCNYAAAKRTGSVAEAERSACHRCCNMRLRAKVERIVLELLRRLDVLPPLRIVKSDEDKGTRH
jgi:hypothetical protein